MRFTIKLLAGLGIAAISIAAAIVLPKYAWSCGWLCCWLHFILIVRR